MADKAAREGLKNWGHGPSSGRPGSVGPHDVRRDQLVPGEKGIDPEAYDRVPAPQPGADAPVNIKPKRSGDAEPSAEDKA
ncbi:hypothetical protein BKE38_16710 [Pseudoroseomonas deserti]|uniref:Uncharacterized protein n=1 Tax=Teichococcus deserti TaxID=1817963 RepID=A0A1V2H249_9PROT|nr:hypothetical protein [Pseudoroseomonas deserti]ONG51078.1 hypothetical protein BKE38_16710 [Pseudoroseomonas deserti]